METDVHVRSITLGGIVFPNEDFVYYISTDLVSWPNVLMKRCEI